MDPEDDSDEEYVSSVDSALSLGSEFGGKSTRNQFPDDDQIDAVKRPPPGAYPNYFEDEPYVPGWSGCVHRKIKHYKKGPTLGDYQFIRKPLKRKAISMIRKKAKAKFPKIMDRVLPQPWHHSVEFYTNSHRGE